MVLNFFDKGLYRADIMGRSRADIKDWPRANFIIFFDKGRYEGSILRAGQGPILNFFWKRACKGRVGGGGPGPVKG